MRIRFAGFNAYLGIVSLAGSLLVVSHAHAGTVSGMDDPNRIPGSFVVVLKRDHIVSLKNPALTDLHEIAVKSEKWQAAKAAADSEVAQIVAKLANARPHAKILAVMSRGEAPGLRNMPTCSSGRSMQPRRPSTLAPAVRIRAGRQDPLTARRFLPAHHSLEFGDDLEQIADQPPHPPPRRSAPRCPC
jgi:hypothetical protein